MSDVRAVAVVVPAHDEDDHLAGCLAALLVARDRLAATAPHVQVTITVALDACTDTSAEVLATCPDADVVVVDARCVGAARSAGTRAALAALTVPLEQVWSAHTDADSRVAATWLTVMVDAADAGVDALLGSVRPDDLLAAPVRAAWSALHPAGEGHPHVHGANFGVRASALAAVGGWRPLVTGEDVDLAVRLRARPGITVRSTANAPVVTSSRAVGRAPAGFSSYLRELNVV